MIELKGFDLTYSERALMAEDYFTNKMKKIKVITSRGDVISFGSDCYNPKGGRCYYLTGHAIMGLEDEDKRVCGVIDVFPEHGRRQEADYTHAWVEFKSNDEHWYVYDPMVNFIIPRELWYKACKPRNIFSELTLRQILDEFVNSKYAHKVDNSTFVFRSLNAERRKPYEHEINNKENGYLFNTLCNGYLEVYSSNPVYVSSFIVHRH